MKNDNKSKRLQKKEKVAELSVKKQGSQKDKIQIQTLINKPIINSSPGQREPQLNRIDRNFEPMSFPSDQEEPFSQNKKAKEIMGMSLFKKFINQKSGNIPKSSSSNNLVNKTMEVKSKNTERQAEQEELKNEGRQRKISQNRVNVQEEGQRKMVVNLKKGNPKKQLENNINTQNFYPEEQYYQSKQYQPAQVYEQPKPNITRSPRPREYSEEQSEVQPYQQNQRLRHQDLEYYESQKLKNHQFDQIIQQNDQRNFENDFTTQAQLERNANQKRKRNFDNPFTKNTHTQKPQQTTKSSPPKQDAYFEEIHQKVPTKPTFNLNEEKYANIQSSPRRSNQIYPHSYNMPPEKVPEKSFYNETYSQIQHQVPIPSITASSSMQYSEAEYKQKYDQLQKKYEELKFQLKNESKHRKKEFSEWEHEIQMLKEKLFDVQSREDSLLIENQRLKDKCESQNLTKMKIQEENKELTFRIKELEDQLQMRETAVKQKFDESTYWKTQVDTLKQELNLVKLGLEKKIDEYNLLYGDYQIVKKERDNKDYLLEDLRRNINSLVEENSLTKDEIFKLVTKLYQMEQQNQVLRNDLKRQQMDTSQIHNYMKDLKEKDLRDQQNHVPMRERVQSSYIERDRQQPQHNIYQPHVNPLERSIGHERPQQNQQNFRNQVPQMINRDPRGSFNEQEKPMNDKPTRRRGQFAKERGQVVKNDKFDRDQRPLPTREQNPQQMKSIGEDHFTSNMKNNPQTQTKPQIQSNHNKFARIQEISQELEKIKDMKAMNGAIRRKKIDLERELQELEQKMN